MAILATPVERLSIKRHMTSLTVFTIYFSVNSEKIT